MNDQPELDFERLAGQGPEVEKFHVDEMTAALRGNGWRTAKALGAARTEADKRVLRAIAEASEGQIISGQKGGYKLTPGMHPGGGWPGWMAEEPGQEDDSPVAGDSTGCITERFNPAAMSFACFHFCRRERQPLSTSCSHISRRAVSTCGLPNSSFVSRHSSFSP